MTKTMNQVRLNLGCLSRSTGAQFQEFFDIMRISSDFIVEALCFAIYFATITSMSAADVCIARRIQVGVFLADQIGQTSIRSRKDVSP
jgi:hypothetical protein